MILSLFTIIILFYLVLLAVFSLKKSNNRNKSNKLKLAFFHPFCNDGGGGEKVLWCMIQALLKETQYQNQNYKKQIPEVAIYSLEPSIQVIAEKVKNRFNVDLDKYSHNLKIIYVPGRNLLVPKSRMTMLCHIFLPMLYCLKCLWKYQPDIFYDTTGFVYTFLPVKLLFLPSTLCYSYVHYPFISSDMIKKIEQRKQDFNNNSDISKSSFKSKLKLIYYKAIYLSYKIMSKLVDKAQANSTWTYNHMEQIWGNQKKIQKLYPPCSIQDLLTHKKCYKQNKIISLAQFRPQKNHKLQIRVIKSIIDQLQKTKQLDLRQSLHLYICGSTRGADDQKLLQGLRNYVNQHNLTKFVSFCVNMKFLDLIQKFKECQFGIHSMEAEHFGISVVQMISAGCITIAHNSAGPKFDIIKDTNLLADKEQDYRGKLICCLRKNNEEKQKIAKELRNRMKKFSEGSFRENFRKCFYEKQKID